jgi:hypothetical protein
LAGAGIIQANGGNGDTSGDAQGGGGGGRIALSVTGTASFTGQLSASNGVGRTPFPDRIRSSVPGTVYLSDWKILPPFLTNGGMTRFTAPSGSVASVTITNYTLYLDRGWTNNVLRAGTVNICNAGKIRSMWNTDTASNWVPDAGVFIECTNLTVDTGGEINVDGMGYSTPHPVAGQSGAGYGPGGGSAIYVAGPGYRCAGAGYGGAGGPGVWGGQGLTYGSAANPADPGSGGGSGNDDSVSANAVQMACDGGGYVRVVASGLVILSGSILANGKSASANYGGGGGSGGASTLTVGSLQAMGCSGPMVATARMALPTAAGAAGESRSMCAVPPSIPAGAIY